MKCPFVGRLCPSLRRLDQLLSTRRPYVIFPVVASLKCSVIVADCEVPEPVNEMLAKGDPSDDGQEAPPPFVKVVVGVKFVRTRLPAAGKSVVVLLVIFTVCV